MLFYFITLNCNFRIDSSATVITDNNNNNNNNTSSIGIVTSSINNKIMEGLIEVVNKLQGLLHFFLIDYWTIVCFVLEVFSKTSIGSLDSEIQLPQIVVIGAQVIHLNIIEFWMNLLSHNIG